jgi:putative membrane protein
MPARPLPALSLAALLFAFLPAALHAQAATPPNDSIQADRELVRHAAADNLLEVQLGQLAQRRATNSTVQKFGRNMVIDHQKLERQWTDLAAKHGMRFKPALSSVQQGQLTRLERAGRPEFDREYMITMIKGHTKDAADLKGAVDSARSEPVRKMAAYELPIVQDHLRNARVAGKEVGVDSTAVARSHIADNK